MTGAVITAAGMSSRMGDFKPMLRVGEMTMVQRVTATLHQAGVSPVVLVTGHNAEKLERHVSGSGVICVRNPRYAETEMLDSALIGLEYLKGKCDRAFVTPVDVPLFTVNTLKLIMRSRARTAKPVCKGRGGHPVLISCGLIPALMKADGSRGLRGALAECGSKMALIEVEDGGVLLDADTPEDYRELLSLHNAQLLRPLFELSLARESVLLDSESARLLRLVEHTGTVSGACARMQISYSKGWKKLSALENALGFPLTDSRPGGESGGVSELTDMGRQLLERFERFGALASQAIDKAFDECFRNSGLL